MKFDMFGRGFTLQLAITVACEMAFILFGYDQGVFSGIVGNKDFLDVMHHPGDGLMGIIVSVYNLGCFSGCILNFFFGEYFGRRRAMWIAMVWILGRKEEALEVLCDVYNKEPDHPDIVKEQGDILQAIELETREGGFSWSKIFQKDEVCTGQRVLLAYGMQFMNQVGGINLVVYFIPTVLENNVGLDRNLSLLLGGVIQIMFLLGSFVPSFLVDRIGRRSPMMWGSLGLGISMMMISILLSFKGSSVEKPTASASVAFFFTNFVIVMITPVIINRLQWKAYLIFMCTNLAFIPLVYFCYPETANLTLEEIDYLFTEPGVSPRHVARRIQQEHKQKRTARNSDPESSVGSGSETPALGNELKGV
ncbi:hypothetical protein FQN53_008013 [Emmonsiellopsis sp. PD_33]|nr:hypothetical protein FQN53_008013 [Emmonsiellopsis sp. PD_33]